MNKNKYNEENKEIYDFYNSFEGTKCRLDYFEKRIKKGVPLQDAIKANIRFKTDNMGNLNKNRFEKPLDLNEKQLKIKRKLDTEFNSDKQNLINSQILGKQTEKQNNWRKYWYFVNIGYNKELLSEIYGITYNPSFGNE